MAYLVRRTSNRPIDFQLEPVQEAHKKDRVESWIHQQVCSGHMLLEDVPAAMEHWQDLYSTLK